MAETTSAKAHITRVPAGPTPLRRPGLYHFAMIPTTDPEVANISGKSNANDLQPAASQKDCLLLSSDILL